MLVVSLRSLRCDEHERSRNYSQIDSDVFLRIKQAEVLNRCLFLRLTMMGDEAALS